MQPAEIRIENARSHNLKGVSCRIPVGSLTVVTGVSGSGKSTLVFDTLYAEGQRRYVASLSTYARQFLERLPRPDVDHVSHMPPAIAIEQRNRVTNARSTVGTATEILDHLRLLYARIGDAHCPGCARPVMASTVQSACDELVARFAGERIAVGAPLPRRPRESARALRDRLARDGFARVLDGRGAAVDWTELAPRALAALAREALLLVDRLRVRASDPGASAPDARLAEAVATAFGRGEGVAVVLAPDRGERAVLREGFVCDGCGRAFPEPVPALFSFNSPLGACQTCQGFGRVASLDRERVIPDPTSPIEEGAVAPFTTRMGGECQRDLLRACRRRGVPVDRPFESLDPQTKEWVFEGDDGDWYGVRGYFDWLERRRYKIGARIQIARYRGFTPCPDCGGTRLRPEALAVTLAGLDLGRVSRMTLAELERWLDGLELGAAKRARGERLLAALRARVRTAVEVGLDYLSLERQVRTLSGGESQRIQLATALGGTLTASLYVLDEPTVGLHARDVARLLSVLERIRDLGNTVVVVEHAPEVVAAADHVIDLGPGAGRLGGRLVAEGAVAEIARHPRSLTGRALRQAAEAGAVRERPPRARARRAARANGKLVVVGASAHNLRDLTVEIPLRQLVTVTGVSGAGKSTLVSSVLVGHLRRDAERGACRRIEGAERVIEVAVVEPRPPGRSSRSNPATVSKAFDAIRRLFASTREARAAGAGPGWFSFNVPGGRCEACEGAGEVVVDMQFLDDVRVPCEACDGTRYRGQARALRFDGRSIVDVLALTVEEAVEAFAGHARVVSSLEPLVRVGLGYLTLGQPLSTLSGGEAQRLRVGLALASGEPDTLYVLDEPTTGLHPADIEVLLRCLRALLETGGSVVVVEHNLDVIRASDHVIDLGPEGGPGGGRLVVAGTPDDVMRCPASHTGAALRGERTAGGFLSA